MRSVEEDVETRQPSKLEEQGEEEAFMYAMQLASFSVLPMVLKSVIELDVLEIIAKAGTGAQVSSSQIAAHLPTHNPDAPMKLDRILRLLASYSILNCSHHTLDDGSIQRLYSLTSVSKFLVKNEDGVSIAPLVLMNQDRVALESWHNLKDTVLEGGIPFNKGHGMASFEYHGTDPTFNKIFNTGMANHSTITMKKILDIYKGFEGLNSLVDVGGGLGATLHMVVSKYPTIRGINFDLAHVIADAPSNLGVDHVSGDMFVRVPKADAVFMKWICHDWSDNHCLKLLKNCYDALPDDGKVILVERILPPTGLETTPAAQGAIQSDCIMLAYNPGGKERTQEEFEALAKGAGFSGFRVVCCAYDNWIMEVLKV